MEIKTQFFSRNGKHQLCYAEFGDPKGYPIIFAHGAPGSHVEGLFFDEEAKNFGFRFIVLDRPGMGYSDFNPKQTLLDYPLDVKALAEHLGLKRFGVMGWSGGGAPTLTCGYVIPDLIDFCIPLAGYTQIDSPELASLIPKADRAGYKMLQKKRIWLFNFSFLILKWMIKLSPGTYLKMFKEACSASDLALLDIPQNIKILMADQKLCFAKGHKGVALDARINYQPWHYDLSKIKARIDLFHGTDDKFVPFVFSERNASLIKNCHLHRLEKQGHMFPMNHQKVIFEQVKKLIVF